MTECGMENLMREPQMFPRQRRSSFYQSIAKQMHGFRLVNKKDRFSRRYCLFDPKHSHPCPIHCTFQLIFSKLQAFNSLNASELHRATSMQVRLRFVGVIPYLRRDEIASFPTVSSGCLKSGVGFGQSRMGIGGATLSQRG